MKQENIWPTVKELCFTVITYKTPREIHPYQPLKNISKFAQGYQLLKNVLEGLLLHKFG